MSLSQWGMTSLNSQRYNFSILQYELVRFSLTSGEAVSVSALGQKRSFTYSRRRTTAPLLMNDCIGQPRSSAFP